MIRKESFDNSFKPSPCEQHSMCEICCIGRAYGESVHSTDFDQCFSGQGEGSYEGVTIESSHAGLMNEQRGIAILIAVLLFRSSRRSWLG